MNTASRTLSGIATIILGAYIAFISFSDLEKSWPGLIWGITFIVIGLFILFNKKEDDIEEIKDSKK